MITNDYLLQASLGPLVIATVDQTQLPTSLAPVENLKSLSLLSLSLSLYLNCHGAVAINVIVVFVFVFELPRSCCHQCNCCLCLRIPHHPHNRHHSKNLHYLLDRGNDLRVPG